jgi:hypothetical protein
MFSRKSETEYEVKNVMIKFVRVFAWCCKVHIICSVLMSGKLQCLTTIPSWKVPDDTTFTVHSVLLWTVCGTSADYLLLLNFLCVHHKL